MTGTMDPVALTRAERRAAADDLLHRILDAVDHGALTADGARQR